MVDLTDYLIKNDADLIKMGEDVRKFLTKTFPKRKLKEELAHCREPLLKVKKNDYTELKTFLNPIQEIRKKIGSYNIDNELIWRFEIDHHSIDFNLGSCGDGWESLYEGSRIDDVIRYIPDKQCFTIWSEEYVGGLFNVLKDYLVKKSTD